MRDMCLLAARSRSSCHGRGRPRTHDDGRSQREPDFDPAAYLPDDLLERFRERAAVHDRENTFPDDDLAELKAAGYLAILAPAELGGGGLGLAEASAPAAAPRGRGAGDRARRSTCTWCGPASRRCSPTAASTRCGSCTRARSPARSSRSGSARRATISCCSAVTRMPRRCPTAAYAFTGTKIFTSLAPVWTQLGLHGLDTTSADAPKLVYAFVDRTDAVVTRDDWDTLGMRGTQSRTTELHGAVAPGRSGGAAHRSRAEPRPDRVRHLQRVRAAARVGLHRHRAAGARPRGRDGRPARGRRRRARRTARIPTSAGASPTWRSRTTRCRRSSRR